MRAYALLNAVALLLLVWLAGRVHGGEAGKPVDFKLTPNQRLTWDGRVVDAAGKDADDDAVIDGVQFGIIPPRPMGVATWLNPAGGVEQRLYARIDHPIPVLRSGHIRLYEALPDLKTLAVDVLQRDETEIELTPQTKIALAATDDGRVFQLTFTKIQIQQDQTDQWQLAGTIHQLEGIVDHIDDPIADRGRAALTNTPLPLSGTIIFGTRQQMLAPVTFHALDLSHRTAGAKEIAAGIEEGRISPAGTMVSRVDSRKLRMSAADGKVLGEIELPDDIGAFNISADGRSVVLSTERYVEVPGTLGRRETATIVYSVTGQKQWEIVGYDDAAFLPDGGLLVTGQSADDGLYIIDAKTRQAKRVAFPDAPAETVEGRAVDWWPRMPAVSPDGKRFAYVSGADVYAAGIDGRGWTPVWLTEYHEPQTHPTFSPDGRYILMIVTPLDVMSGPGDLIVFDIDKRIRQPIEGVKAHSDVPVTWRP